MSVEDNKKIVQTFFERMSAGDVEGAIATFAEDIKWQTIAHTRPGTQSKADKRQSFGAILSTFPHGDFRIWPIAVVAEGDRVCVEAESSGTVAPGKIYNNRYHFAFVLAGGRIIEAREYCDTAYTAEFWAGLR